MCRCLLHELCSSASHKLHRRMHAYCVPSRVPFCSTATALRLLRRCCEHCCFYRCFLLMLLLLCCCCCCFALALLFLLCFSALLLIFAAFFCCCCFAAFATALAVPPDCVPLPAPQIVFMRLAQVARANPRALWTSA